MVNRSPRTTRLTNDAAETDMTRRGVDRLGTTRGRAVTAAVVRRALVRTALQHLAWNFDFRLAGVVARLLATAPRIDRNAAGLVGIGLVPSRVPVGGPFPHIADHVVNAVAVRRECSHRRGSLVSVELHILAWKGTLPGVRHLFAAGCEFVAPGELRTVEPATGGKLPLGFGRQVLACPFCVSQRIAVGDVNDGMIIEPAE